MPPGPSVRVLLFHPEHPVSRATIDWIVDRQGYARVIIPPSLGRLDALPPRALSEPFSSPGPVAARLAAEAAAPAAGPPAVCRGVAGAVLPALPAPGADKRRSASRDRLRRSSGSLRRGGRSVP